MKLRCALCCMLAVFALAACANPPGGTDSTSTTSKETKMSDDDDELLVGSFDRSPPPKVDPVVRDGKRYAQYLGTHDDSIGQSGGLLEISEEATGKRLALIKVYDNQRKPDIEGDVQDIFFASMAFDSSGKLIITDEVGRRFAVDVDKRESQALP
jgi:hypothetical protein